MQRVAEFVERQRLHVVFQVRRGLAHVRTDKCAKLAGRHRQRAAAGQQILHPHAEPPDQAADCFIQRAGVFHLERHAQLQMILQVLADPGQLMHDRNAVLLQQCSRADTGTLQNLRRTHCARGEHGLKSGIGLEDLVALPVFDADDSLAGKAQAPHHRVGDDFQVGALQRGAQKTLGGIPAHAAFLVDFEIAAALVAAAIEIDHLGYADLGGRVAKRVEDLPRQALLLDPPFAAGAVHLVRAARVVFGAFVVGQHIVPSPAGIAERLPFCKIARLAAHVDHAVDRRAAAQHPAARVADRAPVQAGFGLGLEAPVGARVADAIQIPDRNMDPQVVVLAARFEHQHRDFRVGGQAVGQHAAGSAAADDDVVVTADRGSAIHNRVHS